MARALEGTIRPLPSGRFQVRVNGTTIGTYDSMKEAELKRSAGVVLTMRKQLNQGLAESTLKSIAESFFEERRKNGYADVSNEESRWRNHVADASFYAIDVREVTTADITAHMTALAGKKTNWKHAGKRAPRLVSIQVRKKALELIRNAFEVFKDRKIIASNPADDYKWPKTKGNKGKNGKKAKGDECSTYLEREEITRLLSGMNGNSEKWIVQFAIGTGLRLEEQWTLHLADVHAYGDDPHVMVVNGGTDEEERKRGRIKLKTPKNGDARKVPLFGLALEAAREWLKILPSYAPKNPHGLLFPRKGGTYGDDNYVPSSWRVPHSYKAKRAELERSGHPNACKPALHAAGITRNVRWHDLRHSFGTAAVNGFLVEGHAFTLQQVAEWMGHGDLKTTAIYVKVDDMSVRKILDGIDPSRAHKETPRTVVKARALPSASEEGTTGHEGTQGHVTIGGHASFEAGRRRFESCRTHQTGIIQESGDSEDGKTGTVPSSDPSGSDDRPGARVRQLVFGTSPAEVIDRLMTCLEREVEPTDEAVDLMRVRLRQWALGVASSAARRG
jgi:integrase